MDEGSISDMFFEYPHLQDDPGDMGPLLAAGDRQQREMRRANDAGESMADIFLDYPILELDPGDLPIDGEAQIHSDVDNFVTDEELDSEVENSKHPLPFPEVRARCMWSPQREGLPDIVLLQLAQRACGHEFIQDLHDRTNVMRITRPQDASSLFLSNERTAVLVTDAALNGEKASLAKQKTEAANYVKTGGIIVFGFDYAGNTRSAARLFADYELPWDFGDYRSRGYALNPRSTQVNHDGLPPTYANKGWVLKNVAPSDVLYYASSGLDGSGGDKTAEEVPKMASVALGSYGNGKVGFIGGVSPARGEGLVALAMLGLTGSSEVSTLLARVKERGPSRTRRRSPSRGRHDTWIRKTPQQT